MDDEFDLDTPAWRWSWMALPAALALGVRVAVNSVTDDLIAAYNFSRQQEEFRQMAAQEIESLTKE